MAAQEEHDRKFILLLSKLIRHVISRFDSRVSTLLSVTLGILTIGLVNQALSRGDPQKTLAALLLLSGGLMDVVPQNGKRYHDVLTRLRTRKAEVSYTAA